MSSTIQRGNAGHSAQFLTRFLRRVGAAFALYAIVALYCASALAGMGSITGGEQGLWDVDGYSVVVGTIRGIHRSAEDLGTYFATLEPRATLCGHLDPSIFAALNVGLQFQTLTTSIKKLPADGDTVIAVVVQEGDHAGIASSYCRFMPGESGIVTVGGFDDPKIGETLKRLREARKAGEAERSAATTQETAPTSAP